MFINSFLINSFVGLVVVAGVVLVKLGMNRVVPQGAFTVCFYFASGIGAHTPVLSRNPLARRCQYQASHGVTSHLLTSLAV